MNSAHPLIIDVLVVFWLLIIALYIITAVIDWLRNLFKGEPPNDYRNYNRNNRTRM